MADPKNLFLVQGDDEVKIDGWRKRVHDRAAADHESTLEVFPDQTPADEVAARDVGDDARHRPALDARRGRRALEGEGRQGRSRDALTGLPPDTTVGPDRGRADQAGKAGPAPAKLVNAVEKCGGEVHELKAPTRGAVREVDDGTGLEARA